MIAATNGLVQALDNLSSLPDWLSDALCRPSTGGGFATRELYTNAEEAIFNTVRPLIINGIEDVVERPDLHDRCLTLVCPYIPPEQRRDEEQFWKDFEITRPRILGALLDAVACAFVAGRKNFQSGRRRPGRGPGPQLRCPRCTRLAAAMHRNVWKYRIGISSPARSARSGILVKLKPKSLAVPLRSLLSYRLENSAGTAYKFTS
jgi:hypothetical protein